MRFAPLLLLLTPQLAFATPWWIEQERAPELSDALEALWPGHDIQVRPAEPSDGDGIWWADGQLFFREDGQLRADDVAAADLDTQVLLARSWAGSVEVLDGGWLPPSLSSEHHLTHSRNLGGFLRVDASASTTFEPSLSLGGGLAFQRARAGVRLSTAGLDRPLTLSAQLSAWVPANDWAIEIGGGPGLAWSPDTLSPVIRTQATAWAPDLDGNRVGVGIAADMTPAALPQLKDAFAIRAEVSWTFGPSR